MKCGDCGRPIHPARGYCTYFVCHNKMIGGDAPDIKKNPTRTKSFGDYKRCPFCTGERNGKGSCFIAACDRGPNGKSCGCHYSMAGMGSPSQEMWAQARRQQDAALGGFARKII